MRNSRTIRGCLAGLVLLALVAADSAGAAGPASYRKRVAVCIGINNYAGFQPLSCPVRDATLMADVFEAYGFDRVILMTDGEARRERIVAQLRGLAAEMGQDDLFVFYFAGHGQTVRRDNDGLMGYLLPADSRRGHASDDGISMEFITNLIREMPTRDCLLLMDACYSGYAVENRSTGTPEANNGKQLIHILTAGGQMDRAYEAKGHGLFTRHVLDFFRTASSTAGVSTQALAAYVTPRVKRDTAGWQAPRFARRGGGDIVIAMRDQPDTRLAYADTQSFRSSSSAGL